MNRWLDLRLIIGLFFSVIGVLLIIHCIGQAGRGQATVNGWCGAGFLVFGGLMIGASLWKGV